MSHKTLGILLVVIGISLLLGGLVLGIIHLQGHPIGLNSIGLKEITLAAFGLLLVVIGLMILLKGEKTDGKISKESLIPIMVVCLFFGTYIFIGSLIVNDYGVSTDEITQYQMGKVNYEIMTGVYPYETIICSIDNTCYYPPLFEVVLYWLAPTGDSNFIYLRRHQVTFAFFAFSVFIFFLMGRKIFKDWKIGLIGALFLIISPRIFASSFYNSKDIPFLSAYVIAMYTMILALEKKNILTVILHSIATGVACSIRTPGFIIIPITFFFWLFDLVLSKANWRSYLRSAFLLLCFTGVTALLVYLSFPFLYKDPVRNFIESFNIMKQFPWNNIQFFMGHNIGNQIPWFYSIVWFSISSPIFYLVLYILGLAVLIIKTLKTKSTAQLLEKRDLYIALACGILPILIVILMKSVLYNENRQMYFCYPALLLISVYGFKLLYEKIRDITPRWQLWVGLTLLAGLVYPVYFSVRYHPHQNVYFNFLAGSKMSVVRERYSLDTWGLSVKQALEFILETDSDSQIPIAFYESSRFEIFRKIDNAKSILILPKVQSNRLVVTDNPRYVIYTYRYYPLEKPQVPGGKIYYSIKVGDADILTVFKIDENSELQEPLMRANRMQKGGITFVQLP
jgi:hypothetical protein